MRLGFFLLFLCLPATAGRELAAQSRHDSLYKAASESSGKITYPMISEDGNWLTILKRSWVPAWGQSDHDTDTILIFDTRTPSEANIVACRTAIRNLVFTGNNILLLSDSLQTELLDLEKQTSIYYKHVKKTEVLKSKKQFLLHYNKQENNRLEMRDNDGELLNRLDSVYRYYSTKQGNVYAITETGKDEFKITLLSDGQKEQLYKTSRKVDDLEIDPNEQGIMILERDSADNSQEIVYLDLGNKAIYPLKEVLPGAIQKGFTEVIHEGSSYFLKIYTEKEKQDDPVVDIWYGSDNKLINKFYPPTNEICYVWEPVANAIRRIGKDELPRSIYFGSDRYFLVCDPLELNDYTHNAWPDQLRMFYYDRMKDNYTLLDTVNKFICSSMDGQYLLWSLPAGGNPFGITQKTWIIFHIPTGYRCVIENSTLSGSYFTTDGKGIVFDGKETLSYYDLNNNQLRTLAEFPGFEISIQNEISSLNIGLGGIYGNYVNLRSPVILKLYDRATNITSYVLYRNGKSETIIPPSSNRISDFKYNDQYDRFAYTEENYNLPPQLIFRQLKKDENVLLCSEPDNMAIRSLKQKILSYTGSEGTPLTGTLFYPVSYDPAKTYPMVVRIYQVQRKISNEFPVSTYISPNNDGFDLRLLLEKGYFVYFPDIVYGSKGTGQSALDCVNRALDAVAEINSINKEKIGLIGHSHGGYETNFIATHSDRFAAFVPGAGNCDIVRSYFSYNYNFTSPFYWQFENGQYELNKSFKEDKDLYFQNNPIHYVDQVNAPVLLWAGMKDRNIYWEQSMEFYIGLKRNNKKVVALFYPDEGHALYTPDACRDLTSRTLDWFDYFLKDEKDIEWIDRETDRGL